MDFAHRADGPLAWWTSEGCRGWFQPDGHDFRHRRRERADHRSDLDSAHAQERLSQGSRRGHRGGRLDRRAVDASCDGCRGLHHGRIHRDVLPDNCQGSFPARSDFLCRAAGDGAFRGGETEHSSPARRRIRCGLGVHRQTVLSAGATAGVRRHAAERLFDHAVVILGGGHFGDRQLLQPRLGTDTTPDGRDRDCGGQCGHPCCLGLCRGRSDHRDHHVDGHRAEVLDPRGASVRRSIARRTGADHAPLA